MANLRAKHVSCSVVGCSDQHKTLHKTPVSEDLWREWIKFIFDGEVPATVGINLSVCAKHFDTDCFHNLGHYNAGLAAKLFLKEGSIPTIRGERTDDVSVFLLSDYHELMLTASSCRYKRWLKHKWLQRCVVSHDQRSCSTVVIAARSEHWAERGGRKEQQPQQRHENRPSERRVLQTVYREGCCAWSVTNLTKWFHRHVIKVPGTRVNWWKRGMIVLL